MGLSGDEPPYTSIELRMPMHHRDASARPAILSGRLVVQAAGSYSPSGLFFNKTSSIWNFLPDLYHHLFYERRLFI